MTIQQDFERLASAAEQFALTSAEGVSYAPMMRAEFDDDGEMLRLEVGLTIAEAEIDEESEALIRELTLVPSTATDEGALTGNVFMHADDEAVAHVSVVR